MQLDQMSDEEFSDLGKQVLAEQSKRQQSAAEKAKRERIARNKAIFKQKDFLVSIMEHSRTSCSDEDPGNGDLDRGYPRCEKCAVIQLEEWSLEDVIIGIEVTVRPA